ncbi:hypothetical protein [Celerinatantimonas sp. YJH-8]|uniref:hypothetical protein n=1 Tax=Celerinatantimonas sp. YJH-8 TaxID=3228714 RepID=UPI0038C1BAD0
MESVNITELMQGSAKDAMAFAQEQNINLDLSLDSVPLVQQLLELLQEQPMDDKTNFTLSYMLGAYLGELFIRQYGGHWLYEAEQGNEPPQTFVVHEPYKYAFPSLVYHYLQGRQEQPLTLYFEQIAQQHSSFKN